MLSRSMSMSDYDYSADPPSLSPCVMCHRGPARAFGPSLPDQIFLVRGNWMLN